MKKSLLFYFLLFVSVSVFAKTRDVGDALVAGARFVSLTHGGTNKSASMLPTLNLVYTGNTVADKPSFYIFNNDGGGYVIVSADDRATEILAYSKDGRFDINSIPENLRWWLDFYSDEIAYLQTLPEGDAPNKVSPSPWVATSVAPLLGIMKWDQGEPYNMFCPTLPNGKKAAVGCTATAMAQIMGYHKWPVQGKGSKQYQTKTHKFNLSVDFSETYYDWNNMTPTYGATSSLVQKRAVAILSYHCGVGASMDYDSESGASTVEAAKALVNYFGYDKDLNEINRNNFGRDEWAAIIRDELDAARPVLYSGYTSDGGHAFVCDGYDDKGFFHINWGWSGMSDGYYQLTALAPGAQGTGGSAGGFNRNQNAVIGIQKEDNISNPIFNLTLSKIPYVDVASVPRTGKFTMSVDGLWNMGAASFAGYIGVAVCDADGTVRSVIKSYDYVSSPLASHIGYNKFWFNDVDVPSSIPAGDYRLCFVLKGETGNNWQPIRGAVGTPNYVKAKVTASQVIFETTANDYPVLSVAAPIINPAKPYKDKRVQIWCNISNSTNLEYNSVVTLQLVKKNDANVIMTFPNQPLNLTGGETKQVYFSDKVTVEPGEYSLQVLFDRYNNARYPVELSAIPGFNTLVTILGEQIGTPDLKVVGTPSFADNANVPMKEARFTATLKNNGTIFDNKIILFIFNRSGGSSIGYIGYQDLVLDTGDQKNVVFEGDINLPEGDYGAAIFYQGATAGDWKQITNLIPFTLKDIATSVNDGRYASIILYPNPASEFIRVKAEKPIESIEIFNLTGKLVSKFKGGAEEVKVSVASYPAGTYVVKVISEGGVVVRKFIKH